MLRPHHPTDRHLEEDPWCGLTTPRIDPNSTTWPGIVDGPTLKGPTSWGQHPPGGPLVRPHYPTGSDMGSPRGVGPFMWIAQGGGSPGGVDLPKAVVTTTARRWRSPP